MSMTLLLWKAPVTDDPDVVERLVEPYYEHSDDSAFESSPDLAAFASELRARYPEPGGPWADGLNESDRILMLSIRWGAENSFIDAIVELAEKHELVLYDPQGGPDITLPGVEDTPAEPDRPHSVVDYLKFVGMGMLAAGVFWLGWTIDVPVLNWILMIVGGFFVLVIVFLLVILRAGPKEDEVKRS